MKILFISGFGDRIGVVFKIISDDQIGFEKIIGQLQFELIVRYFGLIYDIIVVFGSGIIQRVRRFDGETVFFFKTKINPRRKGV
jgi:hypothetical protein